MNIQHLYPVEFQSASQVRDLVLRVYKNCFDVSFPVCLLRRELSHYEKNIIHAAAEILLGYRFNDKGVVNGRSRALATETHDYLLSQMTESIDEFIVDSNDSERQSYLMPDFQSN